MRLVFLSLAIFGLAGCAHRSRSPSLPPTVGMSQRPYTGTPWYLEKPEMQAARPIVRPPASERQPVVGGRVPEGERLDRLRALLAAADAEIVLVGETQTDEERRALALTVDEIAALLGPYPDIAAEADELRELTANLPTTRAIDLPRVKRRMGQLTDLIRLQLMAGN